MPRDACCAVHSKQCGLNAAVDGTTLLPPDADTKANADERNTTLRDEVIDLHRWIKTEMPHLQRRWKVLTFVPSWGDQWWSPRDIVVIRKALLDLFRVMKELLPYTYVNVIGVSEHVSSLDEMVDSHLWCAAAIKLWKANAFLKSGVNFNSARGADEYAGQINQQLRQIVRDFDDGRTFVVRFRPIMIGFHFERRVMDALTCFHPNKELAESLAFGTLQNMISRRPGDQLARLPYYDAQPDKHEKALFNEFRKRISATSRSVVFA